MSSKYRKILPKPENISFTQKSLFPNKTSSPPNRIYKCTECMISFRCFRHLKTHKAETHGDSVINTMCQYCRTLYPNLKALQQHHADRHVDGKYMCPTCGDNAKLYKTEGYLLKHVQTVHQHKILHFYCSLCPVSLNFANRTAVLEHWNQAHINNNLPPSNENDMDIDDMEMHEEFLDEFLLGGDTNDNSFQFSECWEALDLNLPDMLQPPTPTKINTTLTNTFDSSQKPVCAFNCPKCFENCKNTRTLQQHLKQQHKTVVTNDCVYCTKHYPTPTALKQHLRTVHTLLKRHVCQLCDKQFTTLDHLKKHVLSQHQNERKHICHVCAKSFTQLCHLKQHLAIHTTGKAWQCELCEQKFWRRIDFQRHLIKKHG